MRFSKKLVLFISALISMNSYADYSPVYTCPGPNACIIKSFNGLEFPDGTIQTTAATGGGGGVCGSNSDVQFNNSGSCGASSSLRWDGVNLNASNFALPSGGGLFLDTPSNAQWQLGLNVSGSVGWTPTRLSGDVVYLSFDGSSGNGFAIGNSSSGSSFEIDNNGIAYLYNQLRVDTLFAYSSGNNSYVDVYDGDLGDASSTISVNWSNRLLMDTTGTTTSVDWGGRQLFDSANLESADYNQRVLVSSSGPGSSVDWDNRLLETNGLPIIDWGNDLLYDLSLGQSIDLNNREIFDSSTVQSIDYENRELTASGGSTNTVFSWGTGGAVFPATVISYNGNTTAGNGLDSIVARTKLTGQTSSLGPTTLFTPSAAGEYSVNAYYFVTTAGSAGTLAVSINWTDDKTTRSQNPGKNTNISLTGNNQDSGSIFIESAASHAITYTTTVSGATGSPQYTVILVVERKS